ncbi:MbtH family NRPS accessory protein [Paraburkholderia sp. Se-20369]|nr:MbtH family NRPS accessory protein [Paraburkholderia sp. Se-20369]
MNPVDEDASQYVVVVNDEDQYSIWPHARALPAGWQPAGEPASKAQCLAHIEAVWRDMRPRSLRQAMDGNAPSAAERA